MTITEKLAYVKGLVEGLELDANKPEVKVLSALLELLDDVTLTVSDLENGYDELAEQLDAVDEDLGMLEEDFYDEDCDCCGGDDNDVFYEITCPTCNETVCVSEPIILDGGIDCPSCGEKLEFDLEDLCVKGCDCSNDCDCEPVCTCEPECTC